MICGRHISKNIIVRPYFIQGGILRFVYIGYQNVFVPCSKPYSLVPIIQKLKILTPLHFHDLYLWFFNIFSNPILSLSLLTLVVGQYFI